MVRPEPVRIVVPDDAPPFLHGTPTHRRLETLGSLVLHTSQASSAEELLARVADAAIIVNTRGRTRFPRSVLAALPMLQLISIAGSGADHIDVQAAGELGITIMNAAGASALSVAEGTLALMLAVAHQINDRDRSVRAGQWPRQPATQLYGKTLGVLGTGAIGAQVARLGRGIGMNVIAWSYHPNRRLEEELGVRYLSLEAVLRAADVVSLHMRLTAETRGLLGRAELAMMKPTALLINTARGACVDEAALVEALQAGRLAGAGLDVFSIEPLPTDHPLRMAPNVVMTPHATSVTAEALAAALELAVTNVAEFLAGAAQPRYIVTGPGR